MLKILVADNIAEQGLARLKEVENVQADVRTGLDPQALAAVVGEYDAMIIRSGVKVTGEVLAKPGRLRVIARAGVGVDNVDLAAATSAGVLVINTPDANTVTTAEHTIAMMLARLRRIPQAHQHVMSGGWDRKAFVGGQAAGKVLGIVGMGRVGHAVAERALALRMKVLVCDPILRTPSLMDGRVSVVKQIEELLPQVDCLTLHAALTDHTRNLINADRLKLMKKTAILINCARGGLVDEAALAEALKEGRIAGAAIDVYQAEPPEGSPLLNCDNVVLTPHLGASTKEAQTAVSTDAVEAVLEYLLHETIHNAVNVSDLPADLSPQDHAYLDLISRMASILSIWCAGGMDHVVVTTSDDEQLRALSRTMTLQAVVEMMSPHIEGRLNLVNAAAFADKRGINIQQVAHSARQDFPGVVTVRFDRRGESHEAQGAVFQDGLPRILSVDGYRMEMIPEGRLMMIFNDDQPGVIGMVGGIFGKHQINIADLFLSRQEQTALMVLKSDADVPDAVLLELRQSKPILSVRAVRLPPLDRPI